MSLFGKMSKFADFKAVRKGPAGIVKRQVRKTVNKKVRKATR